MRILLDIPDQHAASLLDVLRHISYVTATPLDADAEPVKKTPKLGGWEGKIQIADDFDAPLEEFADTCGFEEPAPLANKEFKFGCMRGKIWMADDFDAPMEEFAEYM